MKTVLKSISVLAVCVMIVSAVGCGGTGGSEGRSKTGYATSATEIYALGQVLGSQDAVGGIPSDYTRHLKSFDSPFLAQFRLGYDKGYSNYSAPATSR